MLRFRGASATVACYYVSRQAQHNGPKPHRRRTRRDNRASLRELIESEFERQTRALSSDSRFEALEGGTAARSDYDSFLCNLLRTHENSPRILGFLYSIAPPAASASLRSNLVEELGAAGGMPHPQLLHGLLVAAGLPPSDIARMRTLADEDLRRLCADPFLFGTLKEAGLRVMLETVAFEWMLSRLAGEMALFLGKHRGLDAAALTWFTLHSEVDIRHAEEGLDSLLEFIKYYGFRVEDVTTILEFTFLQNVFVERYFGEMRAQDTARSEGDP